MAEYDDFYPDEEERPRDPAVDLAINRLRSFFKQSPQRLFYSTQIETALEREFFHWITGAKGYLNSVNMMSDQK